MLDSRQLSTGRRAALALLLVGVACGKRGAPMPPAPRGPFPPTEVEARQIGHAVRVGFVVPEPRLDLPARQVVAAELLRVDYPPGIEPQADPDVFRRRGAIVDRVDVEAHAAGARADLEDRSLGQLTAAGVGSTLRYAVRLRDRHGRFSPLVMAPDLVPLEPASAPLALGGEPTADGVRLEWAASGSGTERGYNVYRRAADGPAAERPLNAEPLENREYLDAGATVGASYVYTVRGSLGDGPPYRESADSEPLSLVVEDRFAPAAPRGLVAVQEGAAVRLFWDPGPERDVRGYRVYRRLGGVDEAPAGDWARVGPDALERPLYLDGEPGVGRRVSYRVTAVDRAEPPNESAPSEEVEIELGAEPAGTPEGET